MPDDQGSSTRSEEDSRSGLWAGLRTLLFGGDKEPSLREQIEDVIDEAEEEGHDRRGSNIVGDMSPIERKMLRNLLHFGEQTVDDVAVPRADIIAIPESASFTEILAQFAEAGHSRLPVYRENLDEVVGMIHVKDVFAVLAEGRPPPPMIDLLRQPLYVPQSMGVLDLLAEMRAKRRPIHARAARHDQNQIVAPDDGDGQTVGWHRNVAADNSEVGLAFLHGLGVRRQAVVLDRFQPNERALFRNNLGERGYENRPSLQIRASRYLQRPPNQACFEDKRGNSANHQHDRQAEEDVFCPP